MEHQCDNCNQPDTAATSIWVCPQAHEWVVARVVGGLTYFPQRGVRQVSWCKKCLDEGGFGGATSGDFGEWARCPVCGKHMLRG